MSERYGTVIIGTGCAGYNAADRLWGLGVRDIAIITEGRMCGTSRNTGSDKQTYYKLSLCGEDGDSVREMARTLFDGGAVNGDTALIEAAYSVRCFMHLVELGVPFPANECGEYVGYKTDHDPRARATSCGPLTSKLMTEALEREACEKGIPIIDGCRVIKLLTDDDGGVCGLAGVSHNGEISVIPCDNVILATGGPAGIYERSVYPDSQCGSTGLALAAGALGSNLDLWQYGLASTKFRWNVSGTYQQVLPRYISRDESGVEREFLQEKLGSRANDMVFLKGYQWPFDTEKIDTSSAVDLLVDHEISLGRRVYMDFTRNPTALNDGFDCLGNEAKNYLERSGALMGTPIERLIHMNRRAYELYLSHGINLMTDPLEVAVCAQHCNGGIAVDADWQSTVPGLYVIGEAAGTFGVKRPGGSALNSTQVGGLRAAEHIVRAGRISSCRVPSFKPPTMGMGVVDIYALRDAFRLRMSECAAFKRSVTDMRELAAETDKNLAEFFKMVRIANSGELFDIYQAYDILLTGRAVLSAMILASQVYGTHGSSLVSDCASDTDRQPKERCDIILTDGNKSYTTAVRPMPNPELWFENVLSRERND